MGINDKGDWRQYRPLRKAFVRGRDQVSLDEYLSQAPPDGATNRVHAQSRQVRQVRVQLNGGGEPGETERRRTWPECAEPALWCKIGTTRGIG
mgnify:CR=1 FL=1